MTKKDKMYWSIRFDEMADSFDELDEICVEDTRTELHENWRNYIEAGCDVNQIVAMMSPQDAYEQYDVLVSNGAKSYINELFLSLAHDPYTSDGSTSEELAKNYEWFFNRGIDPEVFLDGPFYDSQWIFIIEHGEDLLSKGISKEDLTNKILDSLDYFEDEAFLAQYTKIGLDPVKYILRGLEKSREIFLEFFESNAFDLCKLCYDYGAPISEIEDILEKTEYNFYFEMDSNNLRSLWKSIGIDLTKKEYIWRYLEYTTAFESIDDVMSKLDGSDDFKSEISSVLLEMLSMDEILRDYDDPEYFIQNCVYDVKAFGKKFANEIGYVVDRNCIDWMFFILWADQEALDKNKVYECVLKQDEEDRLDNIEALRGLGMKI